MTEATVTTNSQAAQLACELERKRVLAILALAPEGSVPANIVQAIVEATPAAVFASAQRRKAVAESGAAPGAKACAPAGSKWADIAKRLNEQHRAASAPAAAEGSAT